MAMQKGRRNAAMQPLADILPGMLSCALDKKEDFILTCETDPDTGAEHLYVMTGRFVSACMLRKLVGQAESQREEGGFLLKRRLAKRRTPK